MGNKKILIIANSPGEISGWLKPVVKIIKDLLPDYSISVVLLPCVFASGREKAVVETIAEVDEIIPASRYFSLLFSREDKTDYELLHLGGDIMFTAFLARCWKKLAWSYQWGKKSIDRYYRGYFVKAARDLKCLEGRGIDGNKVHIVGDLLVDSVKYNLIDQSLPEIEENDGSICFMPGSRLKEVRSLIPFFLQVSSLLALHSGSRRFKALISPYIDWKQIITDRSIDPLPELGGLKGVIDEEGKHIVSDDGTVIDLITQNHIRELAKSHFVVTIPGTKTGEAGCLGKPMAVLLPLNKPEDIPYMGIIGLLDWLPLIGPRIKAPLIRSLARNVGLVAQPNILAGKEVVPEIKGVLRAESVADSIQKVLDDNDSIVTMKKELLDIYSPFDGAATRMISIFARTVKPDFDPELPFFTVIICTKDRKELLVESIKTLDAQDFPSGGYEILVVDDGSTDGTDEAIGRLRTKCTLRYFKRPWQGRASARNCGINEARGEVVLFTDDDILAPPQYLKEHFLYHRIYSRTIVRGPIINVSEYAFPENRRAGIADYSQAFFCTCNVSVNRKELLDIGGFDESFVEYGYEDNEVGWRLRQHGLKAHFNMNAIVYHYKPWKKESDLEGMIRNAEELARSAVAYYRKHPHWKTRFATGINPFFFIKHLLLANRFIKDFCLKRWKEIVRQGGDRRLIGLERKISEYYYGEMLKEELKKTRDKNP
ncbi:MAG: glycosyltransferase [Candidatus Xenobiia bacterium LiM19]